MTGVSARNGGLLLAALLLVLYCLYATRAMLYPAIGSDIRVFNSDLLYVPQMVADVLAGGSLSQWYGLPAPAWFPDLALHFIAVAASGGTLPALAIHACAVFALACLSVALLARRLALPGRPVALLAVASTVVAVLLLDAGTVIHGGNFFSGTVDGAFAGVTGVFSLLPASHFTHLLLGLVCLALVIDLHVDPESGRRWRLAVLAALGLLGGVSDALFIPHVAVPLALASAVVGWRAGKICSAGLTAAAVVLAVSLAGLVLNSLLNPFGSGAEDVWTLGAHSESYFQDSQGLGDSHLAKAKQFVMNIPEVLQEIYASRTLLLLVYLGCLALVARRAVTLRRDPGAAASQTPTLLVTIFVVASTLCILAAVLLLTYEPRYLKNVWFYPVVVLPLLSLRGGGGRRFEPLLGAAAAVAVVVLLAFTRAEASRPGKAICADSILSPTGLQRGLATYWIARPASLFSDAGREISPVWQSTRFSPGGVSRDKGVVNFYKHLANVKQRAGRFGFLAAHRHLRPTAVADFSPRYGLPRRLAICGNDLYMLYRPGLIELPAGGQQMG